MHLKIFAVPILVVAMLIISIGYIRPDVDVLDGKKIELASKTDQLSNVDVIVRDADALNSSLDSRSDAEKFVSSYLPASMDQDRTIDMLNFLASQSGTAIVSLVLEGPKKNSAASTAVEDITTASGDPAPVFVEPVAIAYPVSVTVRGSYDSVKSFFDRVAHMDRAHEIVSLKIAVDETALPQDASGAAAVPAGENLLGTIKANMAYFPQRTVKAAISTPVFQKSQLDFASAEKAIAWSTSPVSALEVPQSGRPNPFQ